MPPAACSEMTKQKKNVASTDSFMDAMTPCAFLNVGKEDATFAFVVGCAD